MSLYILILSLCCCGWITVAFLVKPQSFTSVSRFYNSLFCQLSTINANKYIYEKYECEQNKSGKFNKGCKNKTRKIIRNKKTGSEDMDTLQVIQDYGFEKHCVTCLEKDPITWNMT
jgi:hypothetical protein